MADWYIDAAKPDNSGNGASGPTAKRDYSALTVGNGDTVHVAGMHAETVDLSALEGVTLIGGDRESDGFTAAFAADLIIVALGSSCVLDTLGVVMTGEIPEVGNAYAVNGEAVHDTVIQGCRIVSKDFGVQFLDNFSTTSHGHVVRNCIINSAEVGIAGEDSGIAVHDCEITLADWTQCSAWGISVGAVASYPLVVVTNCVIDVSVPVGNANGCQAIIQSGAGSALVAINCTCTVAAQQGSAASMESAGSMLINGTYTFTKTIGEYTVYDVTGGQSFGATFATSSNHASRSDTVLPYAASADVLDGVDRGDGVEGTLNVSAEDRSSIDVRRGVSV
jgi:hypothetical protein